MEITITIAMMTIVMSKIVKRDILPYWNRRVVHEGDPKEKMEMGFSY